LKHGKIIRKGDESKLQGKDDKRTYSEKKKKKLSSQKRPKSGDGGAKFAILQSFTA